MPGMRATIGEFKAGTLRSGSANGPVVRNRKQAIAIGLSEDRKRKVKGMLSSRGQALNPGGKMGGFGGMSPLTF